MITRSLFVAILFATLIAAASFDARSQSSTTGTLNLRNTQPSTVSITIPSTGVTGYSLLLPSNVGSQGQALTIGAVTGTTATLEWSNASFWQLDGTAITTGGTAANEQYMGTSNAQDMVFASNATEAIRIVGLPGPRQGFIGIGTAAPKAPVDIGKTLLLSNSGAATELRFAEPLASGANFTAFRATDQTDDITYTLPASAPASNGMVLTSTTGGTLSWTKPLQNISRGIFVPVVGNFVHVIPAGADITSGSVPIVSMVNPAGTTINASVTAIDDINDTFTVETSIALGAADKICWIIVHPY